MSRPKGEHERSKAGIGRHQSQDVSFPRRAGHQAKHPGAVEARDTIRVDICTAGFADGLTVD